jgi:hypothetical protein
MYRTLTLVVALLLLPFLPSSSMAQQTDVRGLQFVADNATTAANATLVSGPVGGTPQARSLALPAGFVAQQVASG